MTRQTPVVAEKSSLVVTAEELLPRHPCCRPLKHCWCCGWTSLDHPQLLATRLDEYVKAWASGKRERSSAVRLQRIGSQRSAGVDDRAIYTDRGEWANQRTISIEVDAFDNGFWYRNPADNVPPMRGEQVFTAQRSQTASLQRTRRLRHAGRAQSHCGN
jgi:hypothetical protein